MALRTTPQGFAPVWAPESQALILGSYPSPQSVANGFYYGHPRNRFWPLLARLGHAPLPADNNEKAALVLQCGLALWDVLASCEINGASDASIRNAQPNDIAALIKKSSITAVFCNGAAAHRFYGRFCQAQTGLPAQRLPSTSPANAACDYENLYAAWRQALLPYLPAG